MSETLWLWRAWDVSHDRICDCGVVRATDAARAKAIAGMCLGGPHRADVDSIEVENLADLYPVAHAATIGGN